MEKRNGLEILNRDWSFISDKNIILLPIYFCSIFAYSDLGIPAQLGALLFLLWVAGEGIYFYRHGGFERKNWDPVDFMLLVLGAVIALGILSHLRINDVTGYYGLIFFICVLNFWFTMPLSRKHIDLAKRIFIVAGIVVSLLIILHFLFPKMIETVVYAVIADESREYVQRLIDSGYGITIGTEISYTAYFMLIPMGACYADIVSDMRGLKTRKRIAELCVFMIALILLGRRGELLALILTVIIISCMLVREQIRSQWDAQKRKNFKKLLLIAVAVGVVAVILLFAMLPESSNNRYLQTLIDIKHGQQIGNGREDLYQLAWQAFLQHPIFGVGWGGFAEIAPLSGNTRVINVHCIYLQLLCETGIVGTIIICAILFCLLYCTMKRLKHFSKHRERRADCLLAIYLQLLLLVHGVLDNTIYWAHYIILLTFALMLCFRGPESKMRTQQEKGQKKRI